MERQTNHPLKDNLLTLPTVTAKNPHCFVLLDSYSSIHGHMPVIPKRKFESYFEITPDKWGSLPQMIVNEC